MSQEDRSEWLDAIYELHTHSQWFQDQQGYAFSFLWYVCVKDSV